MLPCLYKNEPYLILALYAPLSNKRAQTCATPHIRSSLAAWSAKTGFSPCKYLKLGAYVYGLLLKHEMQVAAQTMLREFRANHQVTTRFLLNDCY